MQAPSQARRVRFGPFEADLRSCELLKHGLKVKLQDQPFQVLNMLIQRPGEMISRQEFRQKLWSADTFVDFDTGLNTAIANLPMDKKALDDFNPSVRGPFFCCDKYQNPATDNFRNEFGRLGSFEFSVPKQLCCAPTASQCDGCSTA